jgi:hypothetical protein
MIGDAVVRARAFTTVRRSCPSDRAAAPLIDVCLSGCEHHNFEILCFFVAFQQSAVILTKHSNNNIVCK